MKLHLKLLLPGNVVGSTGCIKSGTSIATTSQHCELVLILCLPTWKVQWTLRISFGKTKGHSEKCFWEDCQLSSFVKSYWETLKCWTTMGKPNAHQRVSCLKCLLEQGRKFMQSWRVFKLASGKTFRDKGMKCYHFTGKENQLQGHTTEQRF